MNLVSCNGCGVVLDTDKMPLPLDIYDEDGNIDDSKAAYNHKIEEYARYSPCPCCERKVFK